MKLLIGSEKGGAGKSTLATNLAVYLVHEGLDVVLLDADPQSTSAKFIERRNENPSGLKIVHCDQRNGDVSATIKDKASRYQVVIIDAGGGNSRELRTAIAVADLFLTPIRASQADLETLPHVNEMILRAKDLNPTLQAFAVLSMASTNPVIKEAAETAEMIAQFDQLQLANTIIRDRKVYRDALAEGKGVVEMDNSQARAEIQLLGQEFLTSLPLKSNTPPNGDIPGASAARIAAFADGAATRSTEPLPATFFNLRTEPARAEFVVVKGKIKRGDVGKSSYLMIPRETVTRLERVTTGALTPGIIGLVEYALDELERQGRTLFIENHR